ncbi:MAG: hypothetical protein FD143_2555 [Ignavibacteria bacterium]|nr:MAG: hypothetical protein FD143_2555 [Ignavibacteria bacterium]KAF0156399.1 MAG: hypothetical protein FD188_2969 [Ignavibacteria bacterium]
MKKHFEYISEKQIFRLLLSGSDKLLIETRNTNTKEVSFNCFELISGKQILCDLQLEEKTWLGVEAIYKDIIFFHKFPKPNMPGHKEIIAFDIAEKKITWQNKEYAFAFVYEGKVYCYTQGFEERFFYALDYLTGEVKEDIGSNYALINSLRTQAENAKDWSPYAFPKSNVAYADESSQKIITQFTAAFSLVGQIEWIVKNNILLFTFHTKEKNEKFTNRFAAISTINGEASLFETLNENVMALLTDSFFVYKEYLFLLKGKNEVLIYWLTQEQHLGLD